MTHVVLGGFLVAHGLITSAIGVMGVSNPNAPALTLPAWFNWWPGPFGRSWLVDALQLGSGASVIGGFIWLGAGLALIGAGLGFLGLPGLRDVWQTLGFIGGAVGLLALGVYFHPIYLIAVFTDVAIVVLLWGRLVTAS